MIFCLDFGSASCYCTLLGSKKNPSLRFTGKRAGNCAGSQVGHGGQQVDWEGENVVLSKRWKRFEERGEEQWRAQEGMGHSGEQLGTAQWLLGGESTPLSQSVLTLTKCLCSTPARPCFCFNCFVVKNLSHLTLRDGKMPSRMVVVLYWPWIWTCCRTGKCHRIQDYSVPVKWRKMTNKPRKEVRVLYITVIGYWRLH